MDRDEITKLCVAIDKKREEIISLGEKIYRNPETGFKEFGTARLVSEKFEELGLKYEAFMDIPGVKVTLDTGKPGPGVAILGELDAIICFEHPHCNRETGAVHACGHNVQVAAMIGAAIGIMDSGLMGELSGKIHFIATPAEEYIELAYRTELKDKGTVRYLGGKPELLHRGWFNDVDICIMIHVNPSESRISVQSSTNGCIAKKVRYIGQASHAGIAPQDGVNALYAANLGLMAINSLRETFREKDCIRVHPIITKGGDVVSVIPCDVRMETFVRGKSMEAIMDAALKVDRALVGGAVSMGAKVEIENMPGYFPLAADSKLISIVEKLACKLTGEQNIQMYGHGTGSTDIGDLSTIMPVVEIGMGGVRGGLHSSDYRNVDHEVSYILGAKMLAGLTAELLSGDAGPAFEVIRCHKPLFNKRQGYFDFVDSLFSKRLLPSTDLINNIII